MTQYGLRLYVAGHTPNSIRAISNLRRVLEAEFKDSYTLQIIDVLKDPLVAETDRILATPTLIRLTPLPNRRVIGDLSDRLKVIAGLELSGA
ncbi:MAG TPA: circadian clock protein KaiB [Dehalococcoidia bacterium]|nr:circadian clock protein KaiB [Dehalococcoidia bacterium]